MLNEHPHHLPFDEIVKFRPKKSNPICFTKILEVLTTEKVADISISFFLDMASKELGTQALFQSDQYGIIGSKLVNMYFYALYSTRRGASLINIPKGEPRQTLSN